MIDSAIPKWHMNTTHSYNWRHTTCCAVIGACWLKHSVFTLIINQIQFQFSFRENHTMTLKVAMQIICCITVWRARARRGWIQYSSRVSSWLLFQVNVQPDGGREWQSTTTVICQLQDKMQKASSRFKSSLAGTLSALLMESETEHGASQGALYPSVFLPRVGQALSLCMCWLVGVGLSLW